MVVLLRAALQSQIHVSVIFGHCVTKFRFFFFFFLKDRKKIYAPPKKVGPCRFASNFSYFASKLCVKPFLQLLHGKHYTTFKKKMIKRIFWAEWKLNSQFICGYKILTLISLCISHWLHFLYPYATGILF